MTDYSFLERIKILFGLIFSSTFFLSILAIFLLTTFVLVLYTRLKNKYLKYGVAFGYFLIAILIIIKYGSSIILLSDSLVDQVFSFIYFPSVIAYLCMMIITTLLLIMTFINKKLHPFIKICNIISFVIMEILFVLSLDVIVSNNINIYSKTDLYSNSTLMVLIQSSTSIFCIWIFILFINFIVNKINAKLEGKKVNINPTLMEEKVGDKINIIDAIDDVDPTFISDDEFKKSVSNKNKYNDLMDYIVDKKK